MRPVQVPGSKNIRMSYARQKDVLDMPNLIEVQKDSYSWFLNDGLKEAFADISPIKDYSDTLSLEFVDFVLERDKKKYTIEECKEREIPSSARINESKCFRRRVSKANLVQSGDKPLIGLTHNVLQLNPFECLRAGSAKKVKRIVSEPDEFFFFTGTGNRRKLIRISKCNYSTATKWQITVFRFPELMIHHVQNV